MLSIRHTRMAIRIEKWAGKMTQWLRAPNAFPKDQGSGPSTHLAANNCMQLQDLIFSHRLTCRQNANAHEMKVNFLKRKEIEKKATADSRGITGQVCLS